ncbi:MAG: hypothetical protein KGJ23_14815 [Euryarchaeota archaeon]|nr:hypothetical protein [Euryarchaeota archaeon]MDE1837871.1 hypothetical protein [Euryarchaeota archaeon]MDE2046217.1 hypothetical protein [Thermoplasmata archaeon]
MKLERDPAAYLIRSDAARTVLALLRDGRPHKPSEVRKAAGGMHPQILKEAMGHLDTLGLASWMVLPGSKPVPNPHGVALPVVLRITKKGQDVLDHVDHYRALVKRDQDLLPPATLHRWLEV